MLGFVVKSRPKTANGSAPGEGAAARAVRPKPRPARTRPTAAHAPLEPKGESPQEGVAQPEHGALTLPDAAEAEGMTSAAALASTATPAAPPPPAERHPDRSLPLQFKLSLSSPGDALELEADRVAEHVLQPGQPAPAAGAAPPQIQRVCSTCAEGEEELELSAKAAAAQPAEELDDRELDAVGGVLDEPGVSLPDQSRTFFEPRFGEDFRRVRLHTGDKAARVAKGLGARAFTLGHHIVFGPGETSHETPEGTKLLAHELTHVVQQGGTADTSGRGAPTSVARKASPAAPVRRPRASNPRSAERPAPGTATPSGSSASNTPSQSAASPSAASQSAAPARRSAESRDGTPSAGGSAASRGATSSSGATAADPAAAPADAAPAAAVAPPAAVPVRMALTSEPLMPPPPEQLGPAARARLDRSEAAVGGAAQANANLPSAEQNTSAAREAVTEPSEQLQAEASGAVVAVLDERPPPSPEIEELCQRIYQAIRDKRPPDEDSLVDADPQEAAQQAGQQLNSSIQNDTERVGGEYQALQTGAEPASAEPGTSPTHPPEEVATPGVNAPGAAPDPVPAEDLSLDADVQNSSQHMTEAGMDTEPARLVQEGPIAEARAAHGELEQTAARGPAEVAAEQQLAIESAQGDMAALQARALEALAGARSQSITGTASQQTAMAESEEETRARVGREAESLFTTAQSQVRTLLEPLARTAMQRWEAGLPVLSREFRAKLDDVKRRIEDRHSGILGTVVGAVDYVTGLPDWVVERYDEAEAAFGDGVCRLVRDISRDVNAVVAAAEGIITSARERIDALFDELPNNLTTWADEQRGQFAERLSSLSQEVRQARDGFTHDLAQRAAGAVQEVRQEIHSLRQAAGGLLGRIAAAIAEFLDDPVRFIINGLLSLVGISPASFWRLVDRLGDVLSAIADDPIGFANNLLDALKLGFENFFDHIGQHLKQGLLDWLFSGLGAVGVQLPRDMSVRSVVTFFLQLMGLSWANIRKILARHVGERNVALLEQAYQLISTLIEKGADGIFEMLKAQLDPAGMLATVMNAAIEFMLEAVVKRVAARLLLMLNPAGAIVQAIEAIYRVIRWVFENAARIFTLIETIVNGAYDLIQGNVAAMAASVEGALARLIPPVIDFLAGYLGFGDLPEKIADVIRGMQDWVLGIVDRVVGAIVSQAKRLLAALGVGKQPQAAGEQPPADPGQLGERMSVKEGDEDHAVWISVRDGKATVMAASGTGHPMQDLLARFRRDAKQIKTDDEKQEANRLIDVLEGQMKNLDALADDAADDPKAANFDQAKYDAKREQVRHTQESLMEALRQVMVKLGLKKIKPEERLELFRQNSDYRVVTQSEPRFEPEKPPPSEGYRRSSTNPFQQSDYLAFFNDYFRGEGGIPSDVKRDMWDTDRKITPTEFRMAVLGDRRYVLIEPEPALVDEVKKTGAEQLDEALEAAVNELKVVEFMRRVAAGGAPHGIDRAQLVKLWGPPNRSTPNREFLGDRFRAVSRGHHEWIPTDLIPRVVQRASQPSDLFDAADWITVHTEMRTPTGQLIFDPDYKTQVVRSRATELHALQGHSGALYVREELPNRTERFVAQTVGQADWHNELRAKFESSQSPALAVSAAHGFFEETIWTGAAVRADLVPTYSRSITGTPIVTVQTLASDQQKSVPQINDMFTSVEGKVKR